MRSQAANRAELSRRSLVKAGLAAVATYGAQQVGAQEPRLDPKRPVRIIVPYTPGGNIDIVVRAIQSRLSAVLGVPVFVENRPGASTAIGTIAAARSAADGHTLLAVGNTFVSAYVLNRQIGYHPFSDFAALTKTVTLPMVLVVNRDIPVRDVRELIEYLKANPAQATNATSGTGSTSHLACAQFENRTGLQITQIPYKGNSQAMSDVVGRQVTMMFDSLGSAAPHIRENLVRPLAVTTAKRSRHFPELPTLSEAGVAGYEDETFNALVLPKGTPEGIRGQLFAAVGQALNDPKVRQSIEGLGMDVSPSASPAEFQKFLQDNIAIYERVAKNLKVS